MIEKIKRRFMVWFFGALCFAIFYLYVYPQSIKTATETGINLLNYIPFFYLFACAFGMYAINKSLKDFEKFVEREK